MHRRLPFAFFPSARVLTQGPLSTPDGDNRHTSANRLTPNRSSPLFAIKKVQKKKKENLLAEKSSSDLKERNSK